LVAQKAGASAVLVLTYSTHLYASSVQQYSRAKKLNIPIIFIEIDDFTKYIASPFSKNQLIFIKVEGNPVRKKHSTLIFYSR
jgi:hypothetical protein